MKTAQNMNGLKPNPFSTRPFVTTTCTRCVKSTNASSLTLLLWVKIICKMMKTSILKVPRRLIITLFGKPHNLKLNQLQKYFQLLPTKNLNLSNLSIDHSNVLLIWKRKLVVSAIINRVATSSMPIWQTREQLHF